MAPEVHHTPDAFMRFRSVTISDVCKLLESVNLHKATGSDAIPGIVLRDCAHELVPSLTLIFNRSLATACVPPMFKHSYVSALLTLYRQDTFVYEIHKI